MIGSEIKKVIGGKVDEKSELSQYLKDTVQIEDAIERMADLRSTFNTLSVDKDPLLANAIRKLTITEEVVSLVAAAVVQHLEPRDEDLESMSEGVSCLLSDLHIYELFPQVNNSINIPEERLRHDLDARSQRI